LVLHGGFLGLGAQQLSITTRAMSQTAAEDSVPFSASSRLHRSLRAHLDRSRKRSQLRKRAELGGESGIRTRGGLHHT
jgi:hypothetical protein